MQGRQFDTWKTNIRSLGLIQYIGKQWERKNDKNGIRKKCQMIKQTEMENGIIYMYMYIYERMHIPI